MKIETWTVDEADLLTSALEEINERGEEPLLPGVDASGQQFLAYLTSADGEETAPGVLFDEPHQTAYALDNDQPCDECGCPRRFWALDDLEFPVTVLVIDRAADPKFKTEED